jgi:hypothetical protein
MVHSTFSALGSVVWVEEHAWRAAAGASVARRIMLRIEFLVILRLLRSWIIRIIWFQQLVRARIGGKH